jgi:hypothetical protein
MIWKKIYQRLTSWTWIEALILFLLYFIMLWPLSPVMNWWQRIIFVIIVYTTALIVCGSEK